MGFANFCSIIEFIEIWTVEKVILIFERRQQNGWTTIKEINLNLFESQELIFTLILIILDPGNIQLLEIHGENIVNCRIKISVVVATNGAPKAV